MSSGCRGDVSGRTQPACMNYHGKRHALRLEKADALGRPGCARAFRLALAHQYEPLWQQVRTISIGRRDLTVVGTAVGSGVFVAPAGGATGAAARLLLFG